MYNSITLQCTVIKEPKEIKGLSYPLTVLRVACDGDRKEQETLFINAYFYGKNAENCFKFVKKGSNLIIGGQLAAHSYKRPDGINATENQVIVEHWRLLDKKEPELPAGPINGVATEADLSPIVF